MKTIRYVGASDRGALPRLLCAAMIAGIIAGSVYQAKNAAAPTVLVHQYAAPVYANANVFVYALGSFAVTSLFLAAAFLTGLFAFGQPVGAALIFYRGFGIGASAALLYGTFGAKAAAAVFLLLLPKALGYSFISIVAVRELIRASNFSLFCWISEDAPARRTSFKLYCVKFLALIFIALIISALDAAANVLFAGLR